MYLTALYHLMNYYAAQSSFGDALRCGRLILLSDPLREHIHRDLMRLYAANGQRSQAIQQYHTCAEVLRAELGPVSYTHLDVYKRQANAGGCFRRQRGHPSGLWCAQRAKSW